MESDVTDLKHRLYGKIGCLPELKRQFYRPQGTFGIVNESLPSLPILTFSGQHCIVGNQESASLGFRP